MLKGVLPSIGISKRIAPALLNMPMRALAADEVSTVVNVSKSLAGLRILVAEDESLIALDLETMLRGFGCQVIGPVARVDEVISQARAGGLDGALLDVNLRGRQIFEALPEMLTLGLRIVLTSGYDDGTLFPEPFRILPRLSKPFDERSLRRACEAIFLR
jgi:AmiR/NasT family two-component response regulator